MKWWSTPASPRAAFAAAAVIGLTMFLIVYGPGYVLGTSTYWDMPGNDHRSYLMGYRYFLHERWHWPVFEARTLNVPYRQSIAFNDSLPAWALIHKALATIIPPWREPSTRAFLGLWYALASMLQPAFAVANLRAVGHRSWGATIVTSLFFIAIPAWTFRFFHASLYAHFLILWALYLYLTTPDGIPAPIRRRIWQLVQLAVTAMLNPYLTVMSLGVFAASLVRSRSWREIAVWLPTGGGVVVTALAFVGYFSAEATTAQPGFELASSNLLGLVMPRRSGWFGEIAWTDPTSVQFEGICFLGTGFLVLFALLSPHVRHMLSTARRHLALAVVAGGAGRSHYRITSTSVRTGSSRIRFLGSCTGFQISSARRDDSRGCSSTCCRSSCCRRGYAASPPGGNGSRYRSSPWFNSST